MQFFFKLNWNKKKKAVLRKFLRSFAFLKIELYLRYRLWLYFFLSREQHSIYQVFGHNSTVDISVSSCPDVIECEVLALEHELSETNFVSPVRWCPRQCLSSQATKPIHARCHHLCWLKGRTCRPKVVFWFN